MNKLPAQKRALIINMLVEGNSMRSVSRLTDVSINTVTKLVVKAGAACREYHDLHVRDLQSKRIQCDEIWSFCYVKQKDIKTAKAAPEGAGDVWTWTAIDADSKLIASYLAGDRGLRCAVEFMGDLRSRLASRIQLSTDGHPAYLEAVYQVFGTDVDFAMTRKEFKTGEVLYEKDRLIGEPVDQYISTSFAERQNLSMRTRMRRFTRKTNGFSKRVENHTHMLSLYFTFHNFCHVLKDHEGTPAMLAGLADEPRTIDWILGLIEARDPKPGPRGLYKKRAKDDISSKSSN